MKYYFYINNHKRIDRVKLWRLRWCWRWQWLKVVKEIALCVTYLQLQTMKRNYSNRFWSCHHLFTSSAHLTSQLIFMCHYFLWDLPGIPDFAIYLLYLCCVIERIFFEIYEEMRLLGICLSYCLKLFIMKNNWLSCY